jgi:ATP-dependent DNA ligase
MRRLPHLDHHRRWQSQAFSREGLDRSLSPGVEAAAKLPCPAALIDGEIIVQDENGISDFETPCARCRHASKYG